VLLPPCDPIAKRVCPAPRGLARDRYGWRDRRWWCGHGNVVAVAETAVPGTSRGACDSGATAGDGSRSLPRDSGASSGARDAEDAEGGGVGSATRSTEAGPGASGRDGADHGADASGGATDVRQKRVFVVVVLECSTKASRWTDVNALVKRAFGDLGVSGSVAP
jgi:hypothetical protein